MVYSLSCHYVNNWTTIVSMACSTCTYFQRRWCDANALPHAHVVLFDPPTNRKIPSLRPQYLKCAGFADTGWKTLTLSCLPVDKVRRMKLWWGNVNMTMAMVVIGTFMAWRFKAFLFWMVQGCTKMLFPAQSLVQQYRERSTKLHKNSDCVVF